MRPANRCRFCSARRDQRKRLCPENRGARLFLFGAYGLMGLLMAFELSAQTISFETHQVDVSLVPGYNHVPLRIALNSTEPDPDFASVQVDSDATWVTPVLDTSTGVVTLSFATSNLITSSHTATLTASQGEETATLFVQGSLAAPDVTRLVDDPFRSRVYGVHRNGDLQGAVVIHEPVHDTPIGSITVGRMPTDLVVTPDGTELLVINRVSETISVIDLVEHAVAETISLPEYGVHSHGGAANIAVGPGNTIYYSDSAWAPAVRVMERSSGSVIQTVYIEGGGGYGFGDFALSHDMTRFYGWAQFGGWVGSFISRFSVATNGTLTFVEKTNSTWPTRLRRDPTDTPVLISNDDALVFIKELAVAGDSVITEEHAFPTPVYAISPGGEIAVTESAIFEVKTGNRLYDLPVSARAQTVTHDYARLAYFDTTAKQIRFINLIEKIGPTILGRSLSPEDGAFVLPPSSLAWEPVPGAVAYHVYLGDEDVSDADPTSPHFQGVVHTPSFALDQPFTPGVTYYWRIDFVTDAGVDVGAVYSFTVSIFSTSLTAIEAATVQGHADLRVPIELDAVHPGIDWSASAAAPWISFASESGVTPGTVEVILDASVLPVGVHTAEIQLTDAASESMALPVTLTVQPLQLTILKSDPTSAMVYAISENTGGSPLRAYLLEINSETESIERVVYVGSSVTDLAVHHGDQRIYVANWTQGALRAVDMNTFEVVQTYPFSSWAGMGYTSGDVYRISPGAPGRLVIEEQDQWISISLFDTVSGTMIAGTGARQGGGQTDGTGRYYYHGDSNISNASLHKYDLLGDTFVHLGSARHPNVSHFGSRVVVVSEDSQRIFYNGAMYDPELTNLWDINVLVYSTSPDGRLAFGEQAVYDTVLRQEVLSMPVSTQVSAYNSTTDKLIVQVGSALRFYELGTDLVLPAPGLEAIEISANAVTLGWTYDSLAVTFTVQYRALNDGDWINAATVAHNVSSNTVSGLTPETAYEFRIKADSPAYPSIWSEVVTATTTPQIPTAPVLQMPLATQTNVTLQWTASNVGTHYVVERREAVAGDWTEIAPHVPFSTTFYVDTDVEAYTTYHYRVKAVNNGVPSPYSQTRNVTVPGPQPPDAPAFLLTMARSPQEIEVSWASVTGHTRYQVERRVQEEGTWDLIADLPAHVTLYSDTDVVEGVTYCYRVYALNDVGASGPSSESCIKATEYVFLLEDDFDPDLDPMVWDGIVGGATAEGDTGFWDGKALFFDGGFARSATTIPVDTTRAIELSFMMRAGNEAVDGPAWNNSEPGEHVVVEYSFDGLNWHQLGQMNTVYPAMRQWTYVTLPIPSEAKSPQTRFRWRQVQHSGAGYDVWALDDMALLSERPDAPATPLYLFAVPISDVRVGIMWWPSPGASQYVIERRDTGSDWAPLATVSSAYSFYSDDTALPSRHYGYRVKAVNAGGHSLYTWTAFASTYSQLQAWLLDNYGTIEANGAADLAAKDVDGVENIVKYAFNMRVGEPSESMGLGGHYGLPVMWVDTATGQLMGEFIRRNPLLDPGITYLIQFSDDLMEWHTAGHIVAVEDLDQVWQRVRFEDEEDHTRSMRFGRVAIINTTITQ